MNQPGGAVVAEFVTIAICWPCSFVPTYCSYCERNVSKVSTHLYNNWRLVIMIPLLWRQINEGCLEFFLCSDARDLLPRRSEAPWELVLRSAKGVVGEFCVFGALIISGSHKPQVFRSINCQLIMWYYANNNVTSGKDFETCTLPSGRCMLWTWLISTCLDGQSHRKQRIAKDS